MISCYLYTYVSYYNIIFFIYLYFKMTYALLVKKLERMGGELITREELGRYCGELGMEYKSVIGYLTFNRYLERILRGIFYIKSIEERKHNTVEISHLEAIKKALKLKGVKNWYFGLETANSLNNITHEYYTTTFILNDRISRPNPFSILDHKVRLIKISEKLFGFGVTDKEIPRSDPEKTLLDTIYLGRYNRLTETEIMNKTTDLIKNSSKEKLREYAENYPKTVRRFIKKFT